MERNRRPDFRNQMTRRVIAKPSEESVKTLNEWLETLAEEGEKNHVYEM